MLLGIEIGRAGGAIFVAVRKIHTGGQIAVGICVKNGKCYSLITAILYKTNIAEIVVWTREIFRNAIKLTAF